MAVGGVSGSSNNYSYRDQFMDKLTGEEVEGSEETKKEVWNAVFTDEKSNNISVNDFLTLMVAQLKNQDFMNPVDDTQYVTQLAQFATMQQMQDMATYMKTNYVMSLVGKNVTAAKFSVSGELQKEVGAVQKVSLVDNEYSIYVNGTKFSLEQIMEINGTASSSGSGDKNPGASDPAKVEYMQSLMGKEVTVRQRDDKGEPTSKYTGVVERYSTEDGKYRIRVDGTWYPLEDVLEVGDYVEEELPDEDESDKEPAFIW
jgi:hypothetical protein